MHNEHVYLYFRWRRWVALQTSRLMAATFYAQWAEDERSKQCKYDQPALPRPK